SRPSSVTSPGTSSPVVTYIAPPSEIEMKVGGGGGGSFGSGGIGGGRSRRIDTVASGAETMKMMSSTSMTSTKGVTLISAFWETGSPLPDGPESFTAMRQ